MNRKKDSVDILNFNNSCYLTPELVLKFKYLDTHKNEPIDLRSSTIIKSLHDEFFLNRIRQNIWSIFREKINNKSDLSFIECKEIIERSLEEFGCRQLLSNVINKINNISLRNMKVNQYSNKSIFSRRSYDEAIESIRVARYLWSKGISEEVAAMCVESKREYSIPMKDWTNPLLERVYSLESRESVRFLFDSDDLLQTAINIDSMNINSNYSGSLFNQNMGLIKINFQTPSYQQTLDIFPDLAMNFSHLGNDEFFSSIGNKLNLLRQEESEYIVKYGTFHEARNYLKRGSSPSMRGKIWRLAFGLSPEENSDEDRDFQALKSNIHEVDLITDELFVMDVLNIVDDSNYFIFEDSLKELMLIFSRDPYIQENSIYELYQDYNDDCDDNAAAAAAVAVVVDDKGCPSSTELKMPEQTQRLNTLSPSSCSCVHPFLGLASYFAPLCYVFKRGASLYSVARESYTLLWCKLSVISSDKDTILYISNFFENLLLEVQPRLFLHLQNIGIQPLQIAFPWIQSGFVGVLEPDQLLVLWDRIFGYMDLSLLAVLAVAIFVYRSESLLMCSNASFVEKIMSEHSRIKVIPILQMFFYKCPN